MQLLSTKNLDFRECGKVLIESGKLAIFSRSRGGVNNKHFYTVFGLQSIILNEAIHFQKIYANISEKIERVNQKTERNFDKILLLCTTS